MADHDWKTAQSLWTSKRYDACLFYCHLTLEKLLKGLITQETKKAAPYIHDLEELSKKANINPSNKLLRQLAAFTNFNMRCQYPYHKQAFYKLCTREFSKPYFDEAKKYSDLDLCFVSAKFKDTFEAEIYLRTKFHSMDIGFSAPVDIVAFNPKDFKDIAIPLVYEIKKSGREIKLK